MPITVNTNAAASAANYHLSRNQSALQKSLTRLASGSRIVHPVDDAGGLAVSMKLKSSVVRISGAQKNVQNATSFLEVQDGVLDSVGKILNRMVELKGLSDDVMKNSSDIQNYNREFQDLQQQVYDMAAVKFNGVSLFATSNSEGTQNGVFSNLSQDLALDNTVSVFASADGNTGPKVSINKALLLSALTIDTDSLSTGKAYSNALNSAFAAGNDMTFAAEDATKTLDLTDISVAVFTQAIQNVATLRADNAASMSRLNFASQDLALQKTNMEAASGRITDVDIAAESTRLAKYNVLVQASASMLAQANMNSDVALMLLR
jgi:flagellin